MASAPPQSYPPSVGRPQNVVLPLGSKDVERLVLWRDPKVSGAVFVGATVAYWVLALSSVSIASLLSTVGLGVVVVALLWSQAGAWFKSAGPPVPKALREGVSEADARNLAEKLRAPANDVLAVVGRVLSGKDIKLSGMVAGALFISRWVFGYVSVLTLAYTVLVLAFTVPKLYEMRKNDADHVVALVRTKYTEAYQQFDAKVASRIPAAQKKVE